MAARSARHRGLSADAVLWGAPTGSADGSIWFKIHDDDKNNRLPIPGTREFSVATGYRKICAVSE